MSSNYLFLIVAMFQKIKATEFVEFSEPPIQVFNLNASINFHLKVIF